MQYTRLYHLDHKLTPGERIWQLGQLMNFSNKCGNHTIEPNAKEGWGDWYNTEEKNLIKH